MTRPIKFRAWDESRKVMHLEFQFLKSGDSGNDWIIPVKPISDELWVKDLHENIMSAPHCRQQFHLMQFTGLFDKNGKEIYEGDIVLCGDDGEFFSQEYDEEKDEYRDSHKAQIIGPTDTYPAFDIDPNPCEESNGLSQLLAMGHIEVIGNIHENPELLK